uniref:Uncharacterized protein LOC104214512 n=1 Tax=Nicotiana sylvestris TaxID=4096 RepID=A0A1U7VJI7_NICSY|nr:PREDICTED: uncharacterized protein LOC104214512 [Nicotiana sylvestris]
MSYSKSVIRDLIEESQSAFIEGRGIADNILFTHELFKGYNRKGISPRCVIKVDLRKAYDTLDLLQHEWRADKPISRKKRHSTRGLMPPYLFVIAIEYLQRELAQLAKNKNFKFHPRCKKLGTIHICFADDLLMFCKADITSTRLLQQTFLKFSNSSGLQANAEKSSIQLAGISDSTKQDIMQELGYTEGTMPFRYLGVPRASKKLSIIQCWPLVEKITQKINCWIAKLLSYAGRLQLIKLVPFGVQSYWAQIFQLPKKILKMIEAMCRSFLWSGTSTITKKALVAWDKVWTMKKDNLWV